MKHQLYIITKRLATGGVVAAAVGTLTAWQMVSPTLADSVPVIVCQHEGIESFMPDDRDAGLRRAVSMLAVRLQEIPGEIQQVAHGGPPPEVISVAQQIIPLFSATFQYPSEWAVLDNGINDLGVPDFDARVVFDTGSPDEAARLSNIVSGIFQIALPDAALQPSEADPNLLAFPTPFATFLFGPVDDKGLFVMGFDLGGDGINTDRITLTPPSELGAIHPVYQMHVSGDGVGGMVDFFSNMVPDPNAREQIKIFVSKLKGRNVNLDMAGGYRSGQSVSVTKLTNFNALSELFAGGLPNVTQNVGFISKDLFKIVPADARMASAANQNLQLMFEGIIEQINTQMSSNPNVNMNVEDILRSIQMRFGINPMDDLIAHLGSDWVSYTADSTGGGGLMSFVLINKGADTTALQKTFDQLEYMVNDIAEDNANGYIRCRAWKGEHWDIPGLKAGYSLTFPGLPIPLELSLGLTDDCLIAGFTPQAVRAAVLQCSGRAHGSILGNPRFKSAVRGKLDRINKLAFIDYQACIARGYPMAQLFGTAVENFVRSPSFPERDPGVVVPSYADLVRNSPGFLQMTKITENDFVQITRTDASWLANIAGITGAFGISPEAIGAGALGVAIGANAR